MRFLTILFFFISFFSAKLYSQVKFNIGTPLYKNYTSKDYLGHPQLWQTVQLDNGLMLIASTGDAIIFDGIHWSNVLNTSFPRTFFLDSISRQIYFGGDGSFGIIKQDSLGIYKAVIFSDSLSKEEKDFYSILSIIRQKNKIYFVGLKRIFIYENDKLIKSIKSPTDYRFAFTPENNFFIRQSGVGLIKIKNGKFTKVPNSNIFADEGIYFILPYNKNYYLIGTKNLGLYLFKKNYQKSYKNIFIPINNTASDFLKENKINNGIKLNDGRYAISTDIKGIIILNKDLSPYLYFTEDNGLVNNNSNNIFQDKDKNIWITTNNGLSILYYGRNINKITTKQTAKDFMAISLCPYKNYLFAGTMSGITQFKFNNDSIITPENSIKIKSYITKSQVFNITNYNNNFIATSNLGLINFDTTFNPKLIQKIELNFTGIISKYDSSLYINGNLYGLDFYKKNKKWEHIGHIPIDNEVRKIVEAKKSVLYVSTQRKGIFKVTISDYNDIEKYKIIHYDTSNGIENINDTKYLYFWKNNIIALGQYKFLQLNKDSNYFYDITKKTCIAKDSLSIGNLPYMLNSVNLISGKTYYGPNYKAQISEVYVTDTSFIYSDKKFRAIENTGYFDVIDDKYNNCIWFTGPSGLFNYYYNKKDTLLPYKAYIYKVKLANDSLISVNNKNNLIKEFDYKYNSIKFEFSALFYEYPEKTKYQYKLVGFEDNWSKLTKETFTKYTNLPFGEYTFKVKAINIYGQESIPAKFSFKILPPWYLKWWVVIFEIIIVLFLIWLFFKLYTKRLKIQNQKLEKIINDRTSELKEKNAELEKLSIVASETDNAVLIMNPRGDFIWINESLTRKYGFTLDEYVKTKAPNIHQSSSNKNIDKIFNECISSKKSVYYENYTATKTGEKIWTQTTLTPILDNNNNIIYVVAIDTDISQLKEAEQKIKRQNELINYSINYAKSIQDAILPKPKELNNYFDENFIMYKPRDIISGDFYWFYKDKNKKYVVTADSTGHGVPGAFMGIIGQMLLNEIIYLEKTSDLKEILYKLNDKIITTLNQEHHNIDSQNDGMDLSIICYDEQTKELELATANQMIYVFNDNEKIFFEGSVFSIGGIFSNSENVEYISKKITITEDTYVYMFSDGFQDQFGGENNEKFLINRFRKMILDNYKKDLDKQKTIYETEFNNWKKDNKQIDDILLIGFKIKI